jgi:hypothetical protein
MKKIAQKILPQMLKGFDIISKDEDFFEVKSIFNLFFYQVYSHYIVF